MKFSYSIHDFASRATLTLALALAGLLATAPQLSAQTPTTLIDTGQGSSSSIGWPSLFSTGTACTPQPTCATAFQLLAAQFTLTQAATLDSVQLWMIGFGGTLAVRIRSDNHGLPGDTTPPYLGPVSIYEKTYPLGSTNGVAAWVNFPNYNAVLAAGTYWLSLEPVSDSNLNYTMPGGAPNPLPKYAYFDNGNPGYLALNPNPGLGVRILGTNFPGRAFGTATRTILTVNPVLDLINGGDGQALNYHWIIDLNGAGSSFAVGRLNENGTPDDLNGLSAGAYAVTCWSIYSPCAIGAGRGIAYRTFLNTSTSAKTFRINANLEGAFFSPGANRATAFIYAFDTTAFSNTLASHPDIATFLLGRDSYLQLGNADASLSLATLFPGGTLLSSAFLSPLFPAGQVQTAPLSTGLITVAPNDTFTLMFDVTAYSLNGGSSNFSDTLAPASTFFTDSNGNPVTDIIAVGPASIPSAAPASLVLSPGTLTNPVGATYTVTAKATDSTGAPVPNATVFFNIISGPNTGQPGPVVTDASGQATFSYSGTIAGTDVIQANIKTLQSNIVQSIWTVPGALNHIVISPASVTIAPGASQSYTAQGFDKFNNSRGDVTGTTIFTIAPDGSCTDAACTATTPGPHTVTGTNGASTAQASLTISAAQTTPVITWATPAAITYGTPLSATQLNATANVPGSFVYTPGAGAVLGAGNQPLSLTFTPTDTASYTTTSAGVTLVVNKATPPITWATPAAITYGTPLGAAQLNASANAPGALVYTPASGAILNAGSQQLSTTFTPTDIANYTTASASVTLAVNKAAPVLTWATPAAITYGTPLSVTQLNASASVPGGFAYTPTGGTTLAAGTRQLSVLFTPTDATNYTTASANVNLVVNKATPVITWATPAPITAGTPLSATQLNASANVAGAFVYTPQAGTVLNAGNQQLSATFTPTDTADYNNAGAQVMLVVNGGGKTTPVITWPTPAPITHGIPLTSVQLNAKANVSGTFVYSPKAGTILDAGARTLTVTFTPAKTSLYNTATATVTLQVNPAKPPVLWIPLPLVYGAPLGPLQLDALTIVPGKFTYTPAAGTVLPAGQQKLRATFTPRDTTNFQTIDVDATLLVLKATPTIAWAQPAPITAGTPLSATQLNATANVPGTFVYSPTAGTKLSAGTSTLSVTFTPTDSANYQSAKSQVRITVKSKLR